MKRVVATIVVLAIVLALIGSMFSLFIGGNDSPVPVEASPATTDDAATPTTVPVDAPFRDLAAVLPERLDGYVLATGAKATGSLNLDAAVSAEHDAAAERALLETRHYQAGYGRAFRNQSSSVYMAVYDFRNAEDAALYQSDGLITLYGKGASTYDVGDIPGARGFSQGVESNGAPAVVHGVTFTKNDRFVLAFTRAASTSTPEQVGVLARSLYQQA